MASNQNWIQGAIGKPGALHRQLHVPMGKKIPSAKMAAARSGSMGKLAQKRANLAKTLAGLRGNKSSAPMDAEDRMDHGVDESKEAS